MDTPKNQTRWSGRKFSTLSGVCVAAIMLPLDITIVGVALDSIGRDLNASFAGLQWVITGYNMTFGSFLLTAGSLADLFGRRRLFAFGIGLFTLASLLCGFSQNLLILNCFRVLQGFGAAFVLTSGTAVLANEFRSGSERARAFGALGSAFGIGLALGPLIGGVLNSGLGWQWIFWVNIPVGLSVLALAVPKMGESKDPGATRIDWAGLITFTLSLFLLIYALNSGPEAGWGSFRIVGALLGTGILIALFIIAERSQHRPMFDLSLFRKPSFVAAQIVPVAVGFGFVALLVYLPLYFQGVKGYSPLQAGLGMMSLTVPILFVPILAGRLAARIPVRIMLAAGLVLIGLGALWMSGIKSDTNALTIGLGITGIGTGITFGLMDNLAVSVVPAARSGMAAGIFSTMRVAGETIAISLMGATLFSLTKGHFLNLALGASAASVQTAEIANRVARGDINGAVSVVPPSSREVFLQAATQSYISALSQVFVMIAILSFASAVLVITLIRARDIIEEPVREPRVLK